MAMLAALLLAAANIAHTQTLTLNFDPASSQVNFTLGDVLHTVHGTFRIESGMLNLDPASGKTSGEIIVDARSGESGNGMRDRKMHREVIESERYPEIIFRPDRVDGAIARQGASAIRVHGIFAIHGSDHELTVPAQVQMSADRWTATLHFSIPYVKWGMKNPSTLFLRVSESVDIDVNATGTFAATK